MTNKSKTLAATTAASLAGVANASVTGEAYGASMNLAAILVTVVLVAGALFGIRRLRKASEAEPTKPLSALKRQREETRLRKQERRYNK